MLVLYRQEGIMMKKILVVITTGFVSWGGLTTVMMNYYRQMDLQGIRIDFAADNIPDEIVLDEIYSKGSKYYKLSDRKKNIFLYMSNLYNILKKEKYNVIHINGNSSTMAFELIISYLVGVKKRIVHVHTTQNMHPALNRILNPIMKYLMTDAIAVSSEAGKKLYGNKNFIVLNNAVNLERYAFNQEARCMFRTERNIGDFFIAGCVAKLYPVKNHKFLIRVFKELVLKYPNIKLLLVGDGILKDDIQNEINNMGLQKNIILTGMLHNVQVALSAMDLFLLPSFYEGMPLALVEAQANGLCCIASSNITKDANVTGLVKYLDLDKGIWVKEIEKNIEKKLDRIKQSQINCKKIRAKGFDIVKEAGKLRQIYNAK